MQQGPGRLRFGLAGGGLFLLFLATANLTSRHVNDVAAAALASWRLGQFGDLDLSGFADYGWIDEVDGRTVSNRLPGTVLWGAPFYALLGGKGQSVFPAAVAAAAVATAVALVLYLLLRRIASPQVAALACTLTLAGTAFWTTAADGLWTHGPASLFLLLGTWGAAAGSWLPAGLAFGLAVMTRPHLAVVPLVQGLWASVATRAARPAIGIGLGSLIGVAGLLAYNRLAFGKWSLLGGYADPDSLVRPDSAFDLLENLAGTLFSPERGLLLLSPWLLLLVPGIRQGWRTAPQWVRAAAVSGMAYALVQLSLNRFSGGDGFYGNRLMIEPLVLAAPLGVLAYYGWASGGPWRRALFAALAGYSVTFHTLAAVSNHIPLDARDPWKDWLQWEFIVDANPWVVSASLLIGTLATAWASVRAWRGPSIEQPTQSSDLPGPVPVALDPGTASSAQADSGGLVDQEAGDTVGDR